MAVNTSLAPIRDNQFGDREAWHLLFRAGFGGTWEQVHDLKVKGVRDGVDYLVEYEKIDDHELKRAETDPDVLRPATEEERALYQKARKENDEKTLKMLRDKRNQAQRDDRKQARELEAWWLNRMIETPRPLEEKLTLLWHGHFATSYQVVRDSYLMLKQNRMFRKHAAGNFADLAHGIIRDPAMLRFLDNNRNVKQRPNENLSRELMELFTLGEGNYQEHDIKQGARALTGYTFHDNDFVMRKGAHDQGPKIILGKRGTHNGEDFVNILLQQHTCAHFIAYKLYRHFVADVDYDTLDRTAKIMIGKLAGVLRANKLELKPTLKVLFRSQHFYDAQVMGNRIKSPTELIVSSIRSMETPKRDLGRVTDVMGIMGQRLFQPPTVAGWDGGRAWINTSTLFLRQNIAAYLVYGKQAWGRRRGRAKHDYDPTPLYKNLKSKAPADVVDHLVMSILGRELDKKRRDELVAFARKKDVPKPDAVRELLLLITAMPEFQLI